MNRNFKNWIILGLFSIVFLLSSVGSDTAAFRAQNSLEERVDKLFSFLNETDSPGIAVLAVRDGKVLLRKGYGLANLEHRVPITPETVFDIASISKQFCGMAISMLIEEGKISLEDGKLVAKHWRHGTISLTYAYKDDFRGSQYFMSSVEFFRSENGEAAGFNVTAGRSRNQLFTKKK